MRHNIVKFLQKMYRDIFINDIVQSLTLRTPRVLAGCDAIAALQFCPEKYFARFVTVHTYGS